MLDSFFMRQYNYRITQLVSIMKIVETEIVVKNGHCR